MTQPPQTPKIPLHVQRLFARLLAVNGDHESGIIAAIRDLRQSALELLDVAPAEPTKTAAESVVAWCELARKAYVELSKKMEPLYSAPAEPPAPNPSEAKT